MVDKSRLNKLLCQPVQVRDGVSGIERPLRLLDYLPENPEALLSLANHHLVSARQFNRETILQLVRLAAYYEITPTLIHKPLAGKIMISSFSEPSTRTRVSFASAWKRLGGALMPITDLESSGVAKGETLEDVAEMYSNYGDIMVFRNQDSGAIYRMLDRLRIPIINAGNGTDEHPTQALTDLYTIFKWRPELCDKTVPEENRIKIGIIGNPGRMRTIRSLLLLLTFFASSIDEVIIINSDGNVFEAGQLSELNDSGLKVRVSEKLDSILPELDVVYINSIAWVGESYERLTGNLKLDSSSPLKKSAIVLHPLARGAELDVSLDRTPHNWYFAQARGAVFIRMALLTCIMQRMDSVTDVAPDNNSD